MSEPMEAFAEFQKQGKIRYGGVSNHSPQQMAECLEVFPIITNQVGYHLFDLRTEPEIIPFCRDNSMGIMAYGSLAHGLLTGTMTPETTFEDDDWRRGLSAFGQPLFQGQHFLDNLKKVDTLKEIAADRGFSVAQLALAWVASEPTVSTALVGTRRAGGDGGKLRSRGLADEPGGAGGNPLGDDSTYMRQRQSVVNCSRHWRDQQRWAYNGWGKLEIRMSRFAKTLRFPALALGLALAAGILFACGGGDARDRGAGYTTANRRGRRHCTGYSAANRRRRHCFTGYSAANRRRRHYVTSYSAAHRGSRHHVAGYPTTHRRSHHYVAGYSATHGAGCLYRTPYPASA